MSQASDLLRRALDRFASKISFDESSGCWLWLGYVDGKGYGQFSFLGRPVWVHRWAFFMWGGRLGDGQQVHHVCGNPSCCNPDHLCALDASLNAGFRGRPGYVPAAWLRVEQQLRCEALTTAQAVGVLL